MNDSELEPGTAADERPRGGRAAKRTAILDGAVRIFAKDGYSHASIDSLARAAGVSTRTIYNHFTDKADLFRTVIADSAEKVAAMEITLINEHLGHGSSPEAELTAFARAWLQPHPDARNHLALVRQLNAEAEHIPSEIVSVWRDAGPLRVRRALAERFAEWGRSGVLHFRDVQHAAVHFVQLIAAANPGPMSGATDESQTDEWITAGVGAFLRGYGRG
ncbi:MAG TPA: TetR family transcriptional regulator [Microbacterium sp.]|uniref:TetR/AcrR family transcriptional regulator n=1 Tax=Microbacterium sp. TaxID=51671 RepID=UPI000EE87DCE|nr:TetR family transcriptional regulator [Microbacterium sp.]